MMTIRGLHLLLTYQCNFECDHCFVWGGPGQSGTMTLARIREILDQAQTLSTVQRVYFEGGEPFLYYPVLLGGVKEAAARGLQVGLVTNVFWATEVEDALAWLRPLQGYLQDLAVSTDLYHADEMVSRQARNARRAAEQLGISTSTISVAKPEDEDASFDTLMFRGRAAHELAPRAPQHRWETFTDCPYENLPDPGRVHVDPLGYVHLCQGIALGNLFETTLSDMAAAYRPDVHPIVGPLLDGGPAELARRHGVRPESTYADACHLCYHTRLALRPRFPQILTPDQMYGTADAQASV